MFWSGKLRASKSSNTSVTSAPSSGLGEDPSRGCHRTHRLGASTVSRRSGSWSPWGGPSSWLCPHLAPGVRAEGISPTRGPPPAPPPALPPAKAHLQRHPVREKLHPMKEEGHKHSVPSSTLTASSLHSSRRCLWVLSKGLQTGAQTHRVPGQRVLTAVQGQGQTDMERSHTGVSAVTPGFGVKKGHGGHLT